MDNLTIEELRHKILLRLFSGRIFEENHFNYQKLLKRVVYITNELLQELDFDNVWVRFRGEKIFLFNLPTNRIIFEIILDGTKEEGKISQPNILFSNLKGQVNNSLTLKQIIADVEKLGKKGKNGKRNNQR